MNNSQLINFKVLEGVRGLAAFAVVLNHARGNLFIGGGAYLASLQSPGLWDYLIVSAMQITSFGPHAVIVFFVLSGFCITYSVEKHHSVLGFYFRRFMRLYAPYLAGLFLAWLTYVLYFKWGKNLDFNNAKAINPLKSVFGDLDTTVSNLFYLPTGSFIAQYWSLTHEILFYIIAPFVLPKKFRDWYLIVSALLFLFGHLIGQGNGVFTLFLFEYNFYFAVGVLLFDKFELFSSVFGFKNTKLLWIVFGCFLPVILMAYRFKEDAGLLLTALLAVVLIVNSLKFNTSVRLKIK